MSITISSSSPPRAPARSLTNVTPDSSPTLPSPSELFRSGERSPKRFKSSTATRDGIGSGLGSARSLLAIKHGAENLNLPSRLTDTFRPLPTTSQDPKTRFIVPAGSQQNKVSNSRSNLRSTVRVPEERTIAVIEELSEELPLPSQSSRSARAIPKPVIPRRNDWTPLKDDDRALSTELPSNIPTAFPDGLLASFSLKTSPKLTQENPKKKVARPKQITQKKVDLVEMRLPVSNPLTEATKVLQKPLRVPAKKRAKSPAKKPLTITQLATSHYFGNEAMSKETPLMQYFEYTQDKEEGADAYTNMEAEVMSVRQRMTKPTGKKGARTKSKLLSPTSAIKSAITQEAVFGSASQLLRDDSCIPVVHLSSDPVSPDRTQHASTASTTPIKLRGTGQFVRTRNLWAAAGRDEDNALLHVERIDLSETPQMKDAFVGRDVLVAPLQADWNGQGPRLRSTSPSRQPCYSMLRNQRLHADGADTALPHLPTLSGVQAIRPLHTSTAVPQATSDGAAPAPEDPLEVSRKMVSAADKKTPKKPVYDALEISVLQKQVKAFGFKPVKKKEKMIELLERCWEAKHGKKVDQPASETEAPKHGDILSNVHNVSNRPQPKLKKPKKRTKAQTDEPSPTKQTKRRKKADLASNDAAPQISKSLKPRQSRPKKVAAPVPEPTGTMSDSRLLVEQQVTPLPGWTVSETDSEVLQPTLQVRPNSASMDMHAQILAAILKQSDDEICSTRDHIKNPTWHEKILMYDPIILEDLTAWLNVEGLSKVHEDREVDALEVRSWCEANGICCLFKGGWRGQKAKGVLRIDEMYAS